MKVDSKHIMPMFNEVKFLLEGIVEIVRDGSDGFEESVEGVTEDIKKILSAFTVDFMTPETPKIKTEHNFLALHEKLHDKSQTNEGMTAFENVMLFKARLYLFIQAQLWKKPAPKVANRQVISDHVYEQIIYGSPFEKQLTTSFAQVVFNVADLVTDEIIEQLLKYPQLGLFSDNAPTSTTQKLLIDTL